MQIESIIKPELAVQYRQQGFWSDKPLGQHFEEIVNRSVNETFRRSINTSATAFLALLAIYLFGGESVKYFVLALMLGVVVGTYSSIFIASPLLVVWEKWGRKR